MQSEHSSSLKAGSTKNKNSQKAGLNAQVRYESQHSARKASVGSRHP